MSVIWGIVGAGIFSLIGIICFGLLVWIVSKDIGNSIFEDFDHE